MRAAFESADAAVQDEGSPPTRRSAWYRCIGSVFWRRCPRQAFDGVTRLAAAALRVPMLLVSLVDQNRLWFKSRVGLALRESPRTGSFCAQAVLQRQPLMVRDAPADPRFANHPLVTGQSRVRSYLGIPLYTRDRQPVGTLCAMDTEVRDFGEVELVVLSEFAKIAEELLALEGTRVESPTAFCSTRWSARSCSARPSNRRRSASCTPRSTARSCGSISARAALLGYTSAELRELSFRHLTHPDDLPNNVREFKRALAGEIDSYRLEQRLRCKDQRYCGPPCR